MKNIIQVGAYQIYSVRWSCTFFLLPNLNYDDKIQ